MIQYALFASEAAITFRELREFGFNPGDTQKYSIRGCYDGSETLGVFDTWEEAFKALKNCGETTFTQLTAPSGVYYRVREYGIEELEVDEDRHVIQGSDVWYLSPRVDLPEEVLT